MAENRRKTSLFLCRCGTNIANSVDIESVAKWAEKSGDIDVVETYDLLCSPDGKKRFVASLTRNTPESIIIAGCSPKMHEKTFQDLAEESGMNISTVQLANIREQCAWVTSDKPEATEKAMTLINAAVKRSWLSEPLERRSMEIISDILIIGGGIAGIEAALTAATAGREVYLVEKDISIGGSVIRTEEVAPNMDCSPCLLAPRLAAIRDKPNITVIANAEVREVLGFYGNFTVKIHKEARFVDESCIGCEACFEACPVEVESRFHLGLGTRKAIYSLFPGSVPTAAAIDKDNCKHFVDGSCEACVEACPFGSINFEQKDEDIEVQVGAIVVATGFEPGDPSAIKDLGYGKIENVYTLAEFERVASSNGPSGGKIRLKNGKQPSSIAVIHCAGSLREDGIPYCSGICCTGAAKVGELVRKQVPNARIFNICNDLVFPTLREYEFYKRQVNEGTKYLKCSDLKSIKLSANSENIKLEGAGIDPIEIDMVVLATGITPPSGTEALAKMLNIELEENGFFKPDHVLLHATGASLDGIYIAGCAAGPCNVSTAVTRAKAAAGDALSKLVPGREIELEVLTAVIDEEKCGGCKLCIMVCPYKAITYDKEKNVSVVNEGLCRGCGTCAAACPSGAVKAKHFTDDQIYAEIGGLVNV